MAVRYLLWSNKHQMWWRPEARGYTDEIDMAGRYRLDDALSYVTQSAYHGDKAKVTLMVAAPEHYEDGSTPAAGAPRVVVSAGGPTKHPANDLEAEIADLLEMVGRNYRNEGIGAGSRFEGERLEVVQARAAIRRIRERAS